MTLNIMKKILIRTISIDMKKVIIAVLFFSYSLLSSCSGGVGVSGDEIEGYDQMSSCPDVISSLRIIPLEETESSLLTGPVQKVIQVDSMFLVQDSYRALYCFDNTGKFLNSISRHGRSKNEFITLSSFCLDDDGNVTGQGWTEEDCLNIKFVLS